MLCDDLESADIAMAEGFGWIPPLSLIEVFGGEKEVLRLCNEYLNDDYSDLIKDISKSNYDYRKFLKAKV